MAPRRCCCPRCIIFEDHFTRDDAPTLGSDWLDAGSDWAIVSSQAVGTGVAILDIPLGFASGAMIVYFTTIDEQIDDVYKVLVNVVDANNYHIATFTKTGASTGTIAIGRTAAGVYTLTASAAIVGLTGTTRIFSASISTLEFCASVTNALQSLVYSPSVPALFAGGIYSGMDGESTAGDITVDDFVFAHHSETIPFCGSCVCNCEGRPIPPVLTATLTGTGRMSGLSCSFPITWDRVIGNWTGGDTCCATPWGLELICSGTGDVLDFQLTVDICTDSDTGGTPGVNGYVSAGVRTTNEGTCNPFYLLFGPFSVSSTDLSCTCGTPLTISGTYTVEITI